MKKIAMVLAVMTWVFAGLCYYFLYFADAGPDGLGTFFSIIITAILCLFCFVLFSIRLWYVKGMLVVYKLVYLVMVSLPIFLILWKVFFAAKFAVHEIEVLE